MPDLNVNNIPVLSVDDDQFVFFTPPAQFARTTGDKTTTSEAFAVNGELVVLEPQAFEDSVAKTGVLPVVDEDTGFRPPAFEDIHVEA